MTFRIALTGGIASGKSTVGRLFASLRIPVLDSDVIAREVVRPGSAGLAAVVAHFGNAVLTQDGALDRGALGQIIFSNNEKKQILEEILHPLIRAGMARRSEQAGGPYQIFEIPLLTETGNRSGTDRVLVVDCPREIQLARVMARDNASEAHAQRILSAQADRDARLAIADDVIVNDGDVAALEPQVLKLHRDYLRMAARPR